MFARDHIERKLKSMHSDGPLPIVSDNRPSLEDGLLEALGELLATLHDGSHSNRLCGTGVALILGDILDVNTGVLMSAADAAPGERVIAMAHVKSCQSADAMASLSSTVVLWLQGSHWRAVVATQPLSILLDRSATITVGDSVFLGTLISPWLVSMLPLHVISPAEAFRLACVTGMPHCHLRCVCVGLPYVIANLIYRPCFLVVYVTCVNVAGDSHLNVLIATFHHTNPTICCAHLFFPHPS